MPCAMPSSDLSTLASCGMRSVRFPSAPSAMKRCVSMYPTTLCALGVVYRPTRSFQSWARPMCKTVPRTFSTPVAQVEVGARARGRCWYHQSVTQEQTTVSTTSAVCFKTTVSLAFGEVVKVVGSSSLLGNWESDEAPAMTWGEGDEWTLELPLPAGDYSFKFVAYNQATGACRWEGGDDRTITVRDWLNHGFWSSIPAGDGRADPGFCAWQLGRHQRHRGPGGGALWGGRAKRPASRLHGAHSARGVHVFGRTSSVFHQVTQDESGGLQSELDETAAYVKAGFLYACEYIHMCLQRVPPLVIHKCVPHRPC